MSKDGLTLAFDMDIEKCKTCMLSKITKKLFQNVKCETEVLELIHSDLCDLHATPSLGNKKYFVTFVDNALRYAEHSKAFRFYVIKPNESVLINSIIESMDAIFDENIFSSVPRPSQRSLKNGTKDISGLVVVEEVTKEVVQQPEPELRKSKRNRTPNNFEPKFQLYLIEGTKDEVSDQHSYCFNIKDDPKTFDEAMNCKPLGYKWIFKRKLKIDGIIEKFKARLVIQGFRQKLRIDYFDTYALVARISTIRLLIAMVSIHNLIIHQMGVKIAFLNGELEKEVHMNKPHGFIMPGNENKVCKLIKSLYGLKQAPKQWNQKCDKVVMSSGYLLNQADKCVYRKFNETSKWVIICLYVDDMLIFGTKQVQVDLTNKFLSSRFSVKGIGEADVILGIRIKHESNRIEISQSYYIKKVLKKFNYFDYTLVSNPMDTSEKLMPNDESPGITFAMGKLSKYTSDLGTQHWQAIQRISNTKDNSSTSGWVFLLGRGAISWVSKKQTCITGLTIESEFVALAATAPISIRYDSAATLANAYSQMYNGKSRHLGVRYSMIRELITNGMVADEVQCVHSLNGIHQSNCFSFVLPE
ncbi:zinc finger, CCHC-type containing protein [Tanacetum coccineum]